MYICYFDASYFSETGDGYIGIYIEKEKGEIFYQSSIPFQHANGSKDAECLALHEMMKTIKKLNLNDYLIHGDNRVVVEGIFKEDTNLQYDFTLINEIHLTPNNIQWIYRDYNKAHFLTRLHKPDDHVDFEKISVEYSLSEKVFQQYALMMQKHKNRPLSHMEKKFNQKILENKCFSIKLSNEIVAFFYTSLIFFTQNREIIYIYQTEDFKNHYGVYKRNPKKLEELLDQKRRESELVH